MHENKRLNRQYSFQPFYNLCVAYISDFLSGIVILFSNSSILTWEKEEDEIKNPNDGLYYKLDKELKR